jgi:hypothetical protein
MREEVCKHCTCYNEGMCESDLYDIVPIESVCQCGEADKIIEEGVYDKRRGDDCS